MKNQFLYYLQNKKISWKESIKKGDIENPEKI